jgi:hypothetical protein
VGTLSNSLFFSVSRHRSVTRRSLFLFYFVCFEIFGCFVALCGLCFLVLGEFIGKIRVNEFNPVFLFVLLSLV